MRCRKRDVLKQVNYDKYYNFVLIMSSDFDFSEKVQLTLYNKDFI